MLTTGPSTGVLGVAVGIGEGLGGRPVVGASDELLGGRSVVGNNVGAVVTGVTTASDDSSGKRRSAERHIVTTLRGTQQMSLKTATP